MKTKMRAIRIESELDKKLQEYCKQNERSISSTIRYALKKVLTDEGERK